MTLFANRYSVKKKLTLDLAINICLLHEQSQQCLRKDTEVCALQKTRCLNCNGQHSAEKSKCFAYNKRCNNCSKVNHFARCCKSTAQPTAAKSYYQPRNQQMGKIHELNAQPDNNLQDTFYCDPVDLSSQKGEIFTTLKLKNGNGQLKVKVDTGAKCNVVSKRMLNSLNQTTPINTAERVNLVAYGGEMIDTEGTTVLQGVRGEFTFHVVDRDVKPLLGLQDSIVMGLIQLGPDVHMLHHEAPEVREHRDLFDCDVIGSLPVVYHMRLDNTVTPVVCAPRKIPIAMKEKVKAELDHMTELSVITPVTEATEWVSAMVAAKKIKMAQ